MIKAAKARMHKDEDEGFTLIELLVVVLILGILMAIAIPTFLSLTSNAKKNAAEANLTTAIQDAATQYTTNATYGTSNTTADAALAAVDTGLNFVSPATGTASAATTGGKAVSVTWVSANEIIMSTEASDGATWYWADDVKGTTTYNSSTTSAQPATPYSATTLP